MFGVWFPSGYPDRLIDVDDLTTSVPFDRQLSPVIGGEGRGVAVAATIERF